MNGEQLGSLSLSAGCPTRPSLFPSLFRFLRFRYDHLALIYPSQALILWNLRRQYCRRRKTVYPPPQPQPQPRHYPL